MKFKIEKTTAAALAILGALLCNAPAMAFDTPSSLPPRQETRSLDAIHKAALAEGGKLVVYAGGDVPDGNAGVEKAFKERFPGIDIRIITDLSKYHDMRIDQQLAAGRLECDLAHLQTMHDFDLWKAMGVLELYKPLGWDAVYPEFKDPDGAFTAVKLFSFSNTVSAAIPDGQAPRDALDYLDPSLKGKLVLTYPHDDDAVLFQFDRIVSAHGWEYMDKLMRRDVQWIRGTVPASRTVIAGDKAATFTAAGSLIPGKTARFILPKTDTFLVWPQMAAIFHDAKNKESARLYISWMLDKDTIKAMPYQWTVRRDAKKPGGYGPVYDYNTDPGAFRRFMADRACVERLKGRPLRKEGVFIIGSGLSYHNLRMFNRRAEQPSREFDAWLHETVTQTRGAARNELLEQWEEAPSARVCHPREEHLIPLMVAAGCAEDQYGGATYSQPDLMGGIHVSNFRFG